LSINFVYKFWDVYWVFLPIKAETGYDHIFFNVWCVRSWCTVGRTLRHEIAELSSASSSLLHSKLFCT